MENDLDISYIDITLNQCQIKKDDIIVSFGYNKIFVNQSSTFIYETILKSYNKSSLGLGRSFSYTNVLKLPDEYKNLFLERISISKKQFLSFKEFGFDTREQIDSFKIECKNFKYKELQIQHLKNAVPVPEQKTFIDYMEMLNEIGEGLKKLKRKLKFTIEF